jgi:hypothetical protein
MPERQRHDVSISRFRGARCGEQFSGHRAFAELKVMAALHETRDGGAGSRTGRTVSPLHGNLGKRIGVKVFDLRSHVVAMRGFLTKFAPSISKLSKKSVVLAGASSDGFVDRTRRNRSEKLDWRAACGICVSSQNACARPSSCDAPFEAVFGGIGACSSDPLNIGTAGDQADNLIPLLRFR